MANNSYMRNGTGYYRYRSLNDFLTGAAPEAVALTYGYAGNLNPAAEVSFNQYGLYPVSYTHLDVYKRQALPRYQAAYLENRHPPKQRISRNCCSP